MIERSTFSGNVADSGGNLVTIDSDIHNPTSAENSPGKSGAGTYSREPLRFEFSTVSGNSAR